MGSVTNLSTSTKPAPLSWVESLFARMQACYGNKFLDMWRNTDAELVKQLWADEMGKLSNEELKRGYAALMTRDWPPSLPEYVKMCRPPVDQSAAYYEAINGLHARETGEIGAWSHPAIYWTAVSMAFDLKNTPYAQIEKRWNAALEREMSKGKWADIPEPLKTLPAPGKAALSRDDAAKMIKQIGASAVIERKPGSLDWAQKILDRAKAGDKYLTLAVVKMAKEALGKA